MVRLGAVTVGGVLFTGLAVAAFAAVVGCDRSFPMAGAEGELIEASCWDPVTADTDGDKLTQDLEARLGGAGPQAPFRVIVQTHVEPTPARLALFEAHVGPFWVFSDDHGPGEGQGWPGIGFAAAMTKSQIQRAALRADVEVIASDGRGQLH